MKNKQTLSPLQIDLSEYVKSALNQATSQTNSLAGLSQNLANQTHVQPMTLQPNESEEKPDLVKTFFGIPKFFSPQVRSGYFGIIKEILYAEKTFVLSKSFA
jgi:hypothetical protein